MEKCKPYNYSFTMSPDIALEFYTEVKKRNLNTEKERLNLLIELTKQGKIKSISKTSRSKEELIKDLSKHFNVLYIKPKNNETT